ncbi:MAG: hypothetical protein J7L20_01730 [Thermoplasmata archaeon]|nr:hypothetical protein [Thermoplasmata archaeon]
MQPRCLLLVGTLVFLVFSLPHASALVISKHCVVLEQKENFIKVEEIINASKETGETSFLLSVPENASGIEIQINNMSANFSRIENMCKIDATPFNFSMNIFVMYNLPKDTRYVKKVMPYDTPEMTFIYNGKKLFQASDLPIGSVVNVTLPRIKVPDYTMHFVALSAVIVVLLIIIVIQAIRRKASREIEKIKETPEILRTKKSLLMLVLKEIEKLHRSKEITDESYRYLKNMYKKEAVEVMRKLGES